MPKMSKQDAAHSEETPMFNQYRSDIDGYTVEIVQTHQDADLTPFFKGLPDDRCQCPHWGYVTKGRMVWHFADHDEVYEAGDAFYVPPGHTPGADADTEFVQFSPTDELAVTEEVLTKNMEAMQAG